MRSAFSTMGDFLAFDLQSTHGGRDCVGCVGELLCHVREGVCKRLGARLSCDTDCVLSWIEAGIHVSYLVLCRFSECFCCAIARVQVGRLCGLGRVSYLHFHLFAGRSQVCRVVKLVFLGVRACLSCSTCGILSDTSIALSQPCINIDDFEFGHLERAVGWADRKGRCGV